MGVYSPRSTLHHTIPQGPPDASLLSEIRKSTILTIPVEVSFPCPSLVSDAATDSGDVSKTVLLAQVGSEPPCTDSVPTGEITSTPQRALIANSAHGASPLALFPL